MDDKELDTSYRNKKSEVKGTEYGRNQTSGKDGSYNRQEELKVNTSTVKNSTM